MRERPARQGTTVGIDLGGTKIFGALVGADGSTADETYVAHGDPAPDRNDFSPAERAGGAAYARLIGLCEALIAKGKGEGRAIRGVGVGAPGIIRDGGVIMAGNAFGWIDFPLASLLESRLGVPVRVENDVNLAALGEFDFGAGQGLRSLFLMAIGTGIGGGVVIDGKLWRGAHRAAGEIGLLVPGPELLSWRDPQWGALEGVASGTGLAAEGRKASAAAGLRLGDDELRAERVFAAAEAGVGWATAVVDRAVDLWTVAISAVQAVLDPELIVVSGGVSASAQRYLARIEARLAASMLIPPKLVRSELGYRAAVLGAPALF